MANLTLERGNTILVNLGGEDIEVDLADMARIHNAVDLTADMVAVPSDISWVTRLLSAAKKQAELAEADYQDWIATANAGMLELDPKLSEWKAKNSLSGQPGYMEKRRAMAQANELVSRLQGAKEALLQKAEMLRSMGANARSELQHLGLGTRVTTMDKSVEAREAALQERLNR